MADREKVIKGLEICYCPPAKCEDCPYHDLPDEQSCNDTLCLDALSLLKEQKQIKSPDEFKSLLLGMFDSIWDVEIDHPIFQDTVGELMEGVLQAYRQAVKWE